MHEELIKEAQEIKEAFMKGHFMRSPHSQRLACAVINLLTALQASEDRMKRLELSNRYLSEAMKDFCADVESHYMLKKAWRMEPPGTIKINYFYMNDALKKAAIDTVKEVLDAKD